MAGMESGMKISDRLSGRGEKIFRFWSKNKKINSQIQKINKKVEIISYLFFL